ncbi:hypothetical protein [Rufibacter hautae]|uniref:Uncharacterized protein n=1 Tax=Rufibacter hautae TaxID=2595005 RepID=A0A5B6TF21_9BACT|nr:hypothetical protein [Rufibacter hautae]KAA3438471.1 hypothetical protein FOA19_14650 [Rufibacter hautae]
MFSVKSTFFLFLILFFPFILRIKTQHLEPYPALLLPSGATKLELMSDTLEVNSTELYGLTPNGTLKEVNPVRFFFPIPVQYMNPILLNDFGRVNPLENDKGGLVQLLKKFKVLRDKIIDANDEEELSKWLDSKLVEQGFTPGFLKAFKTTSTFSVKANRLLSKKLSNEKIILPNK